MQYDRYIGWTVLRTFLVIAAGLTALFSLLSFVEQLGLVGEGHYRVLDALAYTVLTAPDRLLQLAPVAMLLATLLGLAKLARGSELTALCSFGVSEAGIIGAVVKLCVPVMLVLFLIAQFIIPPAQLAAQRQQAAALGDALPGLSGGGFWIAKDGTFLNVRSFSGGNTLHGIGLYSFNPDGTLRRYLQAESAQIEPDGRWTLNDVMRKQVQNGHVLTDHRPSLDWSPFLSNSQLQLLAMPVQTMPPVALYAFVRQLKRLHEPARTYEQAFWSMVAIPLSLVGMVLIAAPFVFGSQRAGSAGRQVLIGTLLGIVFLLGQQITGYLGLLLELNPAVSALGPSVVLLGLGAWLLDRGHERLAPPLGLLQALQKSGILRFLRLQQD
jgi:lipopolysaccharide export system permease protein